MQRKPSYAPDEMKPGLIQAPHFEGRKLPSFSSHHLYHQLVRDLMIPFTPP